MRTKLVVGVLLFAASIGSAQAPVGISISSEEAIVRVLQNTVLSKRDKPFHALLQIAEPGQPTSPFHGTIEIFWQSPTVYRTVLTSPTFSQTRTINGASVDERNTGDFYPQWLRNYLTALLTPIPRLELFGHSTGLVQLGEHMRSCIRRDDRPGGVTDQLTWASICFSGIGPQLTDVMDFTYFMEFANYRGFDHQQIARTYNTYPDGHALVVGTLVTLTSLNIADGALFAINQATPATQQIATTFVSTTQEESLLEIGDTSPWPSTREGKTSGYMIINAITDRTGRVREAYRHNSDNPGLEAAGVARALHYKFSPLVVEGVPQQMQMPLVLHFDSHIEDAVPTLSGDALSQLAKGCATPTLPKGLLPKGSIFHIRISVNETGKITGESFPEANTNPVPYQLLGAASRSLQPCSFSPYLRDGKATYYHAEFVFTAP